MTFPTRRSTSGKKICRPTRRSTGKKTNRLISCGIFILVLMLMFGIKMEEYNSIWKSTWKSEDHHDNNTNNATKDNGKDKSKDKEAESSKSFKKEPLSQNSASNKNEEIHSDMIPKQETLEKCSFPRPPRTVRTRGGDQYLTPGHTNCTLGWGVPNGVSSGQNLEDAVIYQRFFTGTSPLAHLGTWNGIKQNHTEIYDPKAYRGIYLEMGGLDGITFSNTIMFEQCLGWDGMLIEAQPDNFAELKINRPCAITIEEAACSVEDGPTLHMGGATAVASIIKEGVTKTGESSNINFVEVKCRPLSDMLKQHKIERINFFSLDVERSELDVLKTIDWSNIKIDVLMVESIFNPNRDNEDDMKWKEKIDAVRKLVMEKGNMHQVRSRLDKKDPATGLEFDQRLCDRGIFAGKSTQRTCTFLSIAGSDLFLSPEMFEYDTKPWLFN